jgi:hypothetical protein
MSQIGDFMAVLPGSDFLILFETARLAATLAHDDRSCQARDADLDAAVIIRDPSTPTAFVRRRTSAVKRLRRGFGLKAAEALAKAASG